MPKLTLSADREVIEKAKRLAEERGTSVSRMFRQYIMSLGEARRSRRASAPITHRLRGLAKVSPDRSDRDLFEEAILERERT